MSGSARFAAQHGVSYVEVLIATALLAIALVPAIDALQIGLTAASAHEDLTAEHFHVSSRLEELLAEPFSNLDAAALAAAGPGTPTSYSDPLASASRRLVYLARYDSDDADGDLDPFTGGDDGLLWMRVEAEHSAHGLETLRAR